MRKYEQIIRLHRRSKPKYLFCFLSSELFLLRNVYGSVNIKTVLVGVFFDSIDQNQRTTQIQRVSLYWNLRDFHLNCKRMNRSVALTFLYVDKLSLAYCFPHCTRKLWEKSCENSRTTKNVNRSHNTS